VLLENLLAADLMLGVMWIQEKPPGIKASFVAPVLNFQTLPKLENGF
jgi:hypothetical protein